MKWNPIETMPNDGTNVLACSGHRMMVVNKPRVCALGNWSKHNGRWCGSSVNFAPTHWQHLPEFPVTEGVE